MAETAAEQGMLAGRYRLIEVIGRGGMGVVWRAHDELIGREVAVKQVHAPLMLGENEREVYRERALSEARHAGRISHAGVVAIHDIVPAVRDGDAVSLVMELIGAPTLHDVLTRESPLSPDRVAVIAMRLREALETAHALGVVHRDVKPANIHLLDHDAIKLVDFGIAHALDDPRLTRTGTMGTGAYMAPELFDGQAPSAASDWWSLGVTLRHILTGANVFERNSPAATMRAVLFDPIPATPCPVALSAVISGLLTRDPDERLTAAEVHELLAGATEGRQTAYAKGGTAKWPAGPTQKLSPTADEEHAARHERARQRGDAGDHAGAIAEFARLQRDAARLFGPDHRHTLSARFELARMAGEAGDQFAAVADLEAMLPDVTRSLGATDRLTFDTRRELAIWRAASFDLFEMFTDLQQLRSEVTQSFGPDDELTLDVRLGLAIVRGEYGNPRAAVAELEQLAADSARVLGPGHPKTLTVAHELAKARCSADDHETSIAGFQRVAADRERVLGRDHGHTLQTRIELGVAHRKSGDADTAVTTLERVAADAARALGPHHVHTFDARREWAKAQGKAGSPTAAVAALEALHRDETGVFGAEHLSTFVTRMDVAKWQGKAGSPEGEAAVLERLIHDLERVFGADHPYTLIIRWHALPHGDRLAVPALERLVHDVEAAVGPDHWVSVVSRMGLLAVQSEVGDLDRSAEAARLAADAERVLGADHPFTVNCQAMCVMIGCMNADDPIDAMAEWEPLLPELESVLGPCDPMTFIARGALAQRFAALGDVGRAVSELERLLDDQARVLGPGHPDTVATRDDLEYWRNGTEPASGAHDTQTAAGSHDTEPARYPGDDAAIPVLEERLARQREWQGDDHPDTLVTRHELACLRGSAGDAAAAVSELEEMLPVVTRALGTDHPLTLSTRYESARWRGEAGDVDEAVTALEALLHDQTNIMGRDHPRTVATLHELAYRRGEVGVPEEATDEE